VFDCIVVMKITRMLECGQDRGAMELDLLRLDRTVGLSLEPIGSLRRGLALVDTGDRGHPMDGFADVDAVELGDQVDDVAVLRAREAMPALAVVRDEECLRVAAAMDRARATAAAVNDDPAVSEHRRHVNGSLDTLDHAAHGVAPAAAPARSSLSS